MRPASPLTRMMRQTWWCRLAQDMLKTAPNASYHGIREYRRVAAECQQQSCSQRRGHRFRTKTTAVHVGNEARGSCDRTKRKAQARVGCNLAVREGSSPAMRAVVAGARICQHTYERDALLGGVSYHGQITCAYREKYEG
jgi:hypothetical protein